MTLTRMREIVTSMRLPEGWAGGIDEMNEVVFLLADIAGIDAPDVDIDAMTERALAAQASAPWTKVSGKLDPQVMGYGGEVPLADFRSGVDAIHAAGAHPAAVLTLLARLRRAEAALRALSPAR